MPLLPLPVGASTTTYLCPSLNALHMNSRHLAWPGRNSSCGKCCFRLSISVLKIVWFVWLLLIGSNMAKIILTADVHLGVQNRLRDILWSMRVMREYGYQNDIDLFIVLGDLFHDRKSADIDVLCEVHDFFKCSTTTMGQKWLAFPGNHDMFLKHSWKVNSLKPLSDYVEVVDTIKIVEVEDCRFWILPFIHLESAYMQCLRKMEQFVKDGDILLTHIGVRSAVLNTCFLLKDWSYVDFSDTKFERVYTGHFHSYQQVGDKVWYPGSPIPFKFDEGDVEHGFFVFDTETRTHEFVNIWDAGREFFPDEPLPPQFNTLSDELLSEKTADDVAGCMVRIALTREYTDAEKSKIRSDLVEKGAAGVRFLQMSDGTVTAAEIIKAQEGVLSVDRLFEAFIQHDTKAMKGLNQNLLRRLNMELVIEGDEIYSREKIDE